METGIEGKAYCSCDLLHRHMTKGLGRTRGVATTRYIWDHPRTLGVAFSGGTIALREYIEHIVKEEWQSAISWDFSAPWNEAEIRVELFGVGGWSYIGTVALMVPSHVATMRLGWAQEHFDAGRLDAVDALTLHEFGHALALRHEHKSPASNILWNKPAMYKELVQEGGWTIEDVNATYIDKLPAESSAFGGMDRDSVMIYPVPTRWTLDGWGVPWNTKVSKNDKDFVGRVLYPTGTTTMPTPEEINKIYIPAFFR